jgi:predicted O-methyltransferase YrrM
LAAAYESNIEQIHLLAHDVRFSGIVIPDHHKLKHILGLSSSHVAKLKESYPTLSHKIKQISCGISSNFFVDDKSRGETMRFIYSSFANRGLLVLLKMWPKIYQHYDGKAVLNVYCDLENEFVKDISDTVRYSISQLEGVYYKGWVNKKELADAWKDADVWLYPCIFEETFCISALEAAASRTLVITNDLGALPEVVSDRGIIIEGNPLTDEWQDRALNVLFTADFTLYLDTNYNWALNKTWRKEADNYETLYLCPEVDLLEYRNNYNWTNDVPVGSYEEIRQLLLKFKPKRILEIGTYSGTSIIEMLKILPLSTAHVIDLWENYIEDGQPRSNKINHIFDSFYRNTRPFRNRITFTKDSSLRGLLSYVKSGAPKFDLIYIDGSHRLLDFIGDILISWELLNDEGILLIDDYLYKQLDDNIFDRIKEGVDDFMQTHNVNVIFSNYRVALQKCRVL